MASATIEDGLVDELREAIQPLFADAAKPAELVGIAEVLKPWFATFPQPTRTDKEWADWWHGYALICGHLPKAALDGAMKAWAKRNESEFLPKPGQLADLAKQTPTPAFKLAGRAHQVLQLCDDRLGKVRVAERMEADGVKPADQVEAVKSLLADFNTKIAPQREMGRRVLARGTKNANKTDDEVLPYSGGVPVPGHAITAEMMRALGRPVPKVDPESVPLSDDMS